MKKLKEKEGEFMTKGSTFIERSNQAYGYDIRPIIYPNIGDSYWITIQEQPQETKAKDGKWKPLHFTVDIDDTNRTKLESEGIHEDDVFSVFMGPIIYREIMDLANKKKVVDQNMRFLYKAKLLIKGEEYKNAKESIYNVTDAEGRVISIHIRDLKTISEWDVNQMSLKDLEKMTGEQVEQKPDMNTTIIPEQSKTTGQQIQDLLTF